MGLVYRQQKGEPLTLEEMDGNFAHLEERVKNLEEKPPLAEGVGSLVQEGDQLTVYGTFGTVLGRVTLPKAFPNPRGKWQAGVAYRVLDWVQAEGGVYSCTAFHTSTDFEAEQGYWALVFEWG